MTNAATAAKPARPSSKPIAKRQFGNISVAVFARDVTKPDGTVFTTKDYVLQKSYKDKNGDWQNHSLSLQARDILPVQQALVQTFVDAHDAGDGDE